MKIQLNAHLEFFDALGSSIKENFKPIVYLVSAIAIGILLYQCYRHWKERSLEKDDIKVKELSPKDSKYADLHKKVPSPKEDKKVVDNKSKECVEEDLAASKKRIAEMEKRIKESEKIVEDGKKRNEEIDKGLEESIKRAEEAKKKMEEANKDVKAAKERLEAFEKNDKVLIEEAKHIVKISDAHTPKDITIAELIANSDTFAKTIPFKTQNNLIKNFATIPTLQAEVVEHAKATNPILHPRILNFIPKWIAHKQKYGSPIEQEVYKDMTSEEFINRLIKKRPVAFLETNDSYMLRDGKQGHMGFDDIGTAHEKDLRLEDYQSYSEMSIAAFLSMFVPTHFINEGSRHNRGALAPEGIYEPKGIYVGMVGARFERPGLMEWAHMVVTPEQNTVENGYGAKADFNNPKTKELRLWAELYGSRTGRDKLYDTYSLPTYQDAGANRTGRYLAIDFGFLDMSIYFLDMFVYKERLRLIIEPFLLETNDRCEKDARLGYLQLVGLGLGVWMLDRRQTDLMTEVYAETIAKYDLKNISDLDFSWFDGSQTCGGVASGGQLVDAKGHAINIHFSKRDPAAKLDGKDKDKLLIAQYAWDANAFPGNEYWLGSLSASGDPAAACCSFIAELQNPYINPHVDAKYLIVKG